MIATAQKTTHNKIAPVVNNGFLIQRKCSCGANSKLSGQCEECKKNKLLDVQPKLRIGVANDAFEQEADRIADQVMKIPTSSSAKKNQADARDKLAPVIQRKSSNSNIAETQSPSIVSNVINTAGISLDKSTRSFMESRFGHDFSNVKIHTGNEADRSARSINARAYAVGQHVVMANGQYSPNSTEGRRLLAHELTHTIQQRSPANKLNNVIQRVGFFENIARVFGGGTFDIGELNDYIVFLATTGHIEDKFDSDNKARVIVMEWVKDNIMFVLTTDLKRLLIKEMLSSFTGNDDENAIISILKESNAQEIRDIIDPDKGLYFDDLKSNIHGKEYKLYLQELEGKLSGQADVQAIRQTDSGSSACTFEKTLDILDAENTAEKMLNVAIRKINQYVADLTTGSEGVASVKRIVNCYFKGAQLVDVQRVASMLQNTSVNLRNHDYICYESSNANPNALVKKACVDQGLIAAVFRQNNQPHIRETAICPRFFDFSKNDQARFLVHESAHRAGAIPGSNTPDTYEVKCSQLQLNHALFNADSYAFLVKDLGR